MDVQKIKVKITGLSSIMFDKFIDHSKEQRPPEQKLYLAQDNMLVLPSENIDAFLWGEDPQGCAKSFEGKKGKTYLRIGLGHVFIDPLFIPFCDKKGPIKFEGFDGKKFWCHEGSGRTKQGSRSIKQELKQRPALSLPWTLEFIITVVKNNLIDETKLYNWFMAGGLQIALGTYRPKYGRFAVDNWNVIK